MLSRFLRRSYMLLEPKINLFQIICSENIRKYELFMKNRLRKYHLVINKHYHHVVTSAGRDR